MFSHYRMVEWKDSFETTAGSISTLIRFGYLCRRVCVNQVMWRVEKRRPALLKSLVTQRGVVGGSGAATRLAAVK